jgi:hypothetical protein
MLEHQKIVLEQVSTNKELFKKELVKSFEWLKTYEFFKLRKWVKDRFGRTHSEVIADVYRFLLYN